MSKGQANRNYKMYRYRQAAGRAHVVRFVCCLCACFVMCITGCMAPAFDEEAQKSTTEEAAKTEDLRERYGIPTNYLAQLSVRDSGLTSIEVKDDSIEVPDTSKLYIAHYKKKDLTNERKKEIAEAICGASVKIYAYDEEHRTKADLQKELDGYEKLREMQTDEKKQLYDDEIAALKEELATAPDTYPEAGDYSSDTYCFMMNGWRYQLEFQNGEIKLHIYSEWNNLLNYRPLSHLVAGKYDVNYMSVDDYAEACHDRTVLNLANRCTTSKSEAQKIAADFMEKTGGSDMTLVQVSALGWFYYEMATSQTVAAEADGYEFVYERTISDEKTANIYGYHLDNIDELPTKERYVIDVDKNGVLSAEWTDVLEQDGKLTEAKLLTFDELMEKADVSIAEYYTGHPTSAESVCFNSIRLSYYIRKGKTDGAFDYIPVWIFSEYGKTIGDTDIYAEEEAPSQCVILDATDGSVIDIEELAYMLGKTE